MEKRARFAMKFSVIIPVHNGEKFLNECLDSVLAQKGDFETELVVIENGSTDGSAGICNDYAARHSEVKVFSQEALGAYEGRRRGMRQATGDYLVFLDYYCVYLMFYSQFLTLNFCYLLLNH